MTRYLVVRIGSLLVSLVLATMVVFVIMHSIPGGPFNAEKSTTLTSDQVAAINRFYHLDKPLPVQYLSFLWGGLHLDFGESYQDPGEPITALLGRVWPISAFAGGMGVLIGVRLGMLLGIAAALRRNTWIDYLATLVSIATITLPPFVISIGLLLLFAVVLRWVPASGWNGPPPGFCPSGLFDYSAWAGGALYALQHARYGGASLCGGGPGERIGASPGGHPPCAAQRLAPDRHHRLAGTARYYDRLHLRGIHLRRAGDGSVLRHQYLQSRLPPGDGLDFHYFHPLRRAVRDLRCYVRAAGPTGSPCRSQPGAS